jgi:malate dehydrogenase (oxaloacetate-decarboxylating)(NADP+)
MTDNKQRALDYHAHPTPGKIGTLITKPFKSADELALAYTPGVAHPCLEIQTDLLKAYDYTAKGHTVAVISNGTAVLGLGDIGALASKPVMEGKAVLFKAFGDVDAVDIEVNHKSVEPFCEAVEAIAGSFGGINLEDIKAPECFAIEKRLKQNLNIPVMHDDQHGTAIVAGAALMNALSLVGKSLGSARVVINGAGAAAIACGLFLRELGVKNLIMCDSKGVIHTGRNDLDPHKSAFAIQTPLRTLAGALHDADVFLGLSKGGLLNNEELLASMADKPIIFAMANPVPEVEPGVAKAVRPDAIVATGRSDFPNQINNVLGFPYLFRGALDMRAKAITERMKIAAAKALAALAKEPVPRSLSDYLGRSLHFGPEYILPSPFDPRLLPAVATAVAKAAHEDGVSRIRQFDENRYRAQLEEKQLSVR